MLDRDQASNLDADEDHMGDLEQEYSMWWKKRKLTFDLMSMIATLGLTTSSQYSASKIVDVDAPLVIAVRVMAALAAAAILVIIFKEDLYYMYRDFIMACMWYLLAVATMNYSVMLQLALSKTEMRRAFVSICCNRFIGLFMAAMAWRVPFSWGPSMCTTALFISARGAVRAARLFEEHDPGNPYVEKVAGVLTSAITWLCRSCTVPLRLLVDGAGAFLPCDDVHVTSSHAVLLIWLVTHLLGFWSGFLLIFRDELSDRKAFLSATRRTSSEFLHPKWVNTMMLQVLGVQLFGFLCLLVVGNDF
eukprot:jgi/Botrbrau1/5355/Bobra.0346s0026.1